MAKKAHETESAPFGLDRIVFFSDAVMAIAITLLVIDIKAPEGMADVGPKVVELWPKYLGYFVSFWVIALYWVAHHRCFRYIRSYDRRLIYLNFLFLMFIAFMPFPTSLLFSSPTQSASVMLYAGTAAGMGLSLFLLWTYASRHRFLSGPIPRPVARSFQFYLLLPSLVFIVSAVTAVFSPSLAMYLWFLLIPVYFLRRYIESEHGDSELL